MMLESLREVVALGRVLRRLTLEQLRIVYRALVASSEPGAAELADVFGALADAGHARAVVVTLDDRDPCAPPKEAA